jgi:hypothetical protein
MKLAGGESPRALKDWGAGLSVIRKRDREFWIRTTRESYFFDDKLPHVYTRDRSSSKIARFPQKSNQCLRERRCADEVLVGDT